MVSNCFRIFELKIWKLKLNDGTAQSKNVYVTIKKCKRDGGAQALKTNPTNAYKLAVNACGTSQTRV